ncbi:MAG TPA: phosphatase [Prolixibacteraceae bacterium]|jgi:beta-phosphoglucomutase-like phosphatase (HAD superfamily)|nr:phosphatase [Prolixibacteraceae bacterium]
MIKADLTVNPNAKGLIFDLDGTLADTMPIHYIAWRNAAATYGIDFTTELFSQLAGIPLYPTVERLNQLFGKNIDPREMGDIKEAEFEKNMHLTPEIKPVTDLVRKWHGILPMAVGTGGSRRLSLKTLGIIGLDGYFDILVASEDVSNFKPHPDTFVRCAELMGIDPVYCEVFEDGVLGFQAAKTAGMMVVDVTQYYEVTIGR